MAIEIERKFLLASSDWRAAAYARSRVLQGYLANNDTVSIRVRIAAEEAWLNIKSATLGVHRREYEYAIPVADADELLRDLCSGPRIEKTRHYVRHDGHVWEIDEFHGDNAGLIVAEIELAHPDERFTRPTWLGAEVSHDPRYYNVNLARNPYSRWGSLK